MDRGDPGVGRAAAGRGWRRREAGRGPGGEVLRTAGAGRGGREGRKAAGGEGAA